MEKTQYEMNTLYKWDLQTDLPKNVVRKAVGYADDSHRRMFSLSDKAAMLRERDNALGKH